MFKQVHFTLLSLLVLLAFGANRAFANGTLVNGVYYNFDVATYNIDLATATTGDRPGYDNAEKIAAYSAALTAAGPNDVRAYNGEGTSNVNTPYNEWNWRLTSFVDTTFIPGDVNGDYCVNSHDVDSIYNAIFGERYYEYVDVNGEGEINSADAVAVYNIIYGETVDGGGNSIIEPDNNTEAIISYAIGSSDDLTKIPVIISLDNSIEISAVEGNVRLPGGLGPDKFVYSEDDEDFVYDASYRWNKTHALHAFAGTAAHGQDAFFFSIVSSKSANFEGTDGDIVTFYFDGSSLADGEYEVDFFDALSVWTDRVNTITYKQVDTKCKFIISGGKVTVPNANAKIAELQSLVSSAQTKCNNAVEGTVGGNYNPGSKAALQAVINEVNAKISDTMTDEEIEDATAKINAAVAAFEMQKVYDNYVYPANVEGAAGKQVELPILLKNKAEISDLQFDLVLPEGVSVALDEDGFALIDLSDERTTSKRHTVDYSVRPDSSTRILCTSSKGLTFNGNEGSVVIVTLNVDNEMEEGEYPVIVKEIVMSNVADTYEVPQTSSTLTIVNYVLGDINFDGNINVGDLSRLTKMILNDYTEKDNTFKAADINGDNTLNVGDYSKLVKMILSEPVSANKYVGGVKSKAYAVSSADVEIDNATVAAGGEKQIAVRLNNNGESFVAMQFDIALPEGLTLAEGGLETSVRTKGFNVETNGKRVVVYNTSNNAIGDTEGDVLYLTLKADKEMLSGNYDVDIDNIIFATKEADVVYANAYRSQINVDKLTNVGGVETGEGMTATAVSGGIAISSDKDQTIAIYTPAGVLVAKEQIASGETKRISLSKGVYVVNNAKIIVE